jgi:uncharacterized protein (DUF488 family)
MTPPRLCTIGYEGTSVGLVLAALLEAGVRHLIDVRAVSSSRKPGFSRRQLAAAATEAGLRYTHLQALGTPKPGRDAARHGDGAIMRRVFAAHLREPETQAALAQAAALVTAEPCCLLCYERDHALCHRAILAGLLAAESGAEVTHLLPALPGEVPPR